MGRTARGVRGIRLGEGDHLVEMVTVDKDGHILIVTEEGYGKRTSFSEFRTQARGGKGVKAVGLTNKSGKMVGGKVVTPGDDLMIVTARGILIRQKVDAISILGRSARGVKLIKLDSGDRVMAVARVVREDKENGEE